MVDAFLQHVFNDRIYVIHILKQYGKSVHNADLKGLEEIGVTKVEYLKK